MSIGESFWIAKKMAAQPGAQPYQRRLNGGRLPPLVACNLKSVKGGITAWSEWIDSK